MLCIAIVNPKATFQMFAFEIAVSLKCILFHHKPLNILLSSLELFNVFPSRKTQSELWEAFGVAKFAPFSPWNWKTRLSVFLQPNLLDYIYLNLFESITFWYIVVGLTDMGNIKPDKQQLRLGCFED